MLSLKFKEIYFYISYSQKNLAIINFKNGTLFNRIKSKLKKIKL